MTLQKGLYYNFNDQSLNYWWITPEKRMNMQEYRPFKEGKVREIYDNGDSLIMVATDRIFCVLPYFKK